MVLESGACHQEEERKGDWPDSHVYEIIVVRDGRWPERPAKWIRHSEWREPKEKK